MIRTQNGLDKRDAPCNATKLTEEDLTLMQFQASLLYSRWRRCNCSNYLNNTLSIFVAFGGNGKVVDSKRYADIAIVHSRSEENVVTTIVLSHC